MNILDRYLEKKNVIRDDLQLLGCTAMVIASKYEEIYAPECKDFVTISDNAFRAEDLLRMEGEILNELQFQITFPSAFVFLSRYSKVSECSRETRLLAQYCIERCLQEYQMLKYLPSMMACAGLFVARAATMHGVTWDAMLEKHTKYVSHELHQCVEDIRLIMKHSKMRSLQAVRKKYKNQKTYLDVAHIRVWD